MWIAYLLLAVSALCLCGMSLIRKQYQREVGTSVGATIFFMGAYSLIVVLVGTIIVWISSGNAVSIFSADWLVLLFATILSITITATTIIVIIGSAYGSLSILIMMATLGTLVLSSVYGLIFDSERNTLNAFTVIGFLLASVILALSVIEKPKTEEAEGACGEKNKREGLIYRLLCVVIFFSNGIALVIYSMMTKYRGEYGNVEFIVLYSFAAVIICSMILLCLFAKKKNKPSLKQTPDKTTGKIVPLIIGYALLFGGGEISSLFCTGFIPIVVQAPLSFVIQLLLLTVFDYFIFKAKITKINLIQMLLAVVASIMFAL